MEPPVRVTLDVATVAVPPQLVAGSARDQHAAGQCVGKRSASTWPERCSSCFRVMVRVEIPPNGMEAGLKDLRRLGETLAVTVKVAPAAPVLLPMLVCSAPTASVLMKAPAEFALTFTVTVQEPLAGMEPPVNVTLDGANRDCSHRR